MPSAEKIFMSFNSPCTGHGQKRWKWTLCYNRIPNTPPIHICMEAFWVELK